MDNGAGSYRRFRDNGDESGLDEIIRTYRDGLTLYLSNLVENIRTAEELAEDTFVLIGIRKPRFKGKSTFKTWLYAIGRHLALDYLRKQAKHPAVPLDELPEQAGAADAVEAAYFRKERQRTLHRAMQKLHPEYRQVLWLIYFEGFTNKEAADIMRKSVRGVESVLYRARKSLKAQLEAEGFDDEEL